MVYIPKARHAFFFGIVALMMIFIISSPQSFKFFNNISGSLPEKERDEKILNIPKTDTYKTHSNISSSTEKSSFLFLPKNLKYCEDLIPKEEKRPSFYKSLRPAFDRVLQTESKVNEGHSGRKMPQTYAYLQLGRTRFVKTICETGFNAGHSTLAWLAADPHTHIYSFDLGQHTYSRPMAAFLRKSFPGRLTNIWGDSTVTIPHFTKNHPDVVCDLIVVDGGHSYEVAMADLKNFRQLASKNYNIVIIDDCPSTAIPQVLKAWRDMLKTGYLEESWKCQFMEKNMGGFTIGKYVTSNK